MKMTPILEFCAVPVAPPPKFAIGAPNAAAAENFWSSPV